MDMHRFEAHKQYQQDLLAEAQQARLRKLALQARRGTPGVYRTIRLQAGRGLIAAGRFLVDQAGEATAATTWEMQREV